MRSARVQRTSLHEALAPAQQRLPTAGKIRPGIKVLTKAARDQIPGAEKIYADGVASGVSFDDIERTLKQVNTKLNRRPLTPRNTPYFRVQQQDFTAPGAAAAILEMYGNDKNDGAGQQIYTFPIEFITDDIDANFREQFEAWKSSELFRWSEPGKDDSLKCMMRQEVKADRSKRKRWGSRQVVVVGDCNPNTCDIFAAGNCQHNGTLYFTIPGCEFGIFELSFTSVYASLGVVETCDLVEKMLGRVRGTLSGIDTPIFWITKKRKNVSMVDWEKGKATRQDQWIITLVPNLKGIAEHIRNRNDKTSLTDQGVRDQQQLSVVKDAIATTQTIIGDATAGADDTPPSGSTESAPDSASETGALNHHDAESIHNLRAKRKQLADEIGYTTDEMIEVLKNAGFAPEEGKDVKKLIEQIKLLQGFLDRQQTCAIPVHGDHAAQDEQVDPEPEPVQGKLIDQDDPF